MPERCPIPEGETFDESELLFAAPQCWNICIPRALKSATPITVADTACTHDIVHNDGFLENVGGNQRTYEEQSICLETGDTVLIEKFSFDCSSN